MYIQTMIKQFKIDNIIFFYNTSLHQKSVRDFRPDSD